MRWGVAAVLTLLVIAGGLFYGPLRDFTMQQDTYQKELAALRQLEQENEAMREQIAGVRSDAWLEREARSQFQLVPSGWQAFVVTNLPSGDGTPRKPAPVRPAELTLAERLSDLWRTLLN